MNNYQTKFLIKAAICLWIASLVACGGGGGGVVDAVTNKWTTNAGIYSACDSHSKISVTLAPVGINQMSLSFKQDVFALDNCSGAIVGSVSPWSLTFTYLSTIVASVSGIGSGTAVQSLSIDKVTVNMPAQSVALTGTGVNGGCIYYLNGNSCPTLVYPANTFDAAIYISATIFSGLTLVGSTWAADKPNLIKQ